MYVDKHAALNTLLQGGGAIVNEESYVYLTELIKLKCS